MRGRRSPAVRRSSTRANSRSVASADSTTRPFRTACRCQRPTGTCTICHDSPNIGNHSVKAPLDIGLTAPDVAPYLPVYTLRNRKGNQSVRTTDPGRALITGKWRDVNRFKGPILRGLAGRAPYFHNGAAATLDEVVDFYEVRFEIGLTARDKADLVAFLRSL